MKKFEGVLICTDLDGTLLDSKKRISRENSEAIEYFKSEGGYFTFVTGRMPFYAIDSYEAVRPNAPIGCINGGGLYDYEKEKYIWTEELPRGVTELIKAVDESCDGASIQVSLFDKVYFSKDNVVMEHFRAATKLPNVCVPYTEVTEPIAKIIFGCDTEEDIALVERTLRAHPLADSFEFIRSEKRLFEILPKGIGKGTALVKLAEHLGIDMKKTVAIGDYDNDISMLRAAGAGIAVANASENAKAAADFITVSNNESAIAKVVYELERFIEI